MTITLRKKKNKPILTKSKYIFLKEIWGKPKPSEPRKNKATEQPEITQQNKKPRNENWKWNKTSESIEKIIDNKPKEKENNIEKEGWQDPVDWNKVLVEHRNRLEQETLERVNRYKKQNKKHESWELYRLCKKFLEQNNEKWNKKKEQDEIERNRIQQLEQARIKAISTMQKVVEKEQNRKLEMLPTDILRKAIMEQAKEEKLEIKMAKEPFWKLRTTERKIEQTKEISEIRKLEKRKETVTKVLEMERKKLMEQEQEIKNTKTRNNKSKKNNKEENIRKLRKVGEIWTTYRWITEYIQ